MPPSYLSLLHKLVVDRNLRINIEELPSSFTKPECPIFFVRIRVGDIARTGTGFTHEDALEHAARLALEAFDFGEPERYMRGAADPVLQEVIDTFGRKIQITEEMTPIKNIMRSRGISYEALWQSIKPNNEDLEHLFLILKALGLQGGLEYHEENPGYVSAVFKVNTHPELFFTKCGRNRAEALRNLLRDIFEALRIMSR